jgi:hypothetical protein
MITLILIEEIAFKANGGRTSTMVFVVVDEHLGSATRELEDVS